MLQDIQGILDPGHGHTVWRVADTTKIHSHLDWGTAEELTDRSGRGTVPSAN